MGTNGKYWDVSRNPVFGCTKCSPGCDNCWAEKMALRLKGMGRPEYRDVVDKNGWTGLVKFDRSKLVKPIPGRGKVVFMGDMADVFHEQLAFEETCQILEFATKQKHHKFLFCTKRAERMLEFFQWQEKTRPMIAWRRYTNLIGMLTVCNQEEADEKIPLFLQSPWATKVLSIEPCLGEIELRGWTIELLDGVILGGESGPRPMHPDWARSVRDQCAAAGVSFYFKQWNPHKVKHRLLDGREHNELPWRPK